MKEQNEGKNCYVANPRDGSVYPSELNKDNTLFYPEAGMTTLQQCQTGQPRDFHIVTDSHLLVPLYDRRKVFIWREGKWINPDFQTYGCSYDLVLTQIFGYGSSIPQAVLDGKTTNCMGHKLAK